MSRTRIKLAVYVDLGDVPGEFHSADSARNVIASRLTEIAGHYNPVVSIESHDVSKQPWKQQGEPAAKEKLSQYAKAFNSQTTPFCERNNDVNQLLLRAQVNYFNQRLQGYGYVFLNDVYETLGLARTAAGQLVGWVSNGDGDGYIDFLIGEPDGQGTIMLDFNVDGVIIDKINQA